LEEIQNKVRNKTVFLWRISRRVKAFPSWGVLDNPAADSMDFSAHALIPGHQRETKAKHVLFMP